jgi:hypothetical protein
LCRRNERNRKRRIAIVDIPQFPLWQVIAIPNDLLEEKMAFLVEYQQRPMEACWMNVNTIY